MFSMVGWSDGRVLETVFLSSEKVIRDHKVEGLALSRDGASGMQEGRVRGHHFVGARKILRGFSGGTRGPGCRKGNLGGGIFFLQPRKIFRALFWARGHGKGNLFSEPIKNLQNHFLGEWGSERHFFSSQKSPHPPYSLSLSVAIFGAREHTPS